MLRIHSRRTFSERCWNAHSMWKQDHHTWSPTEQICGACPRGTPRDCENYSEVRSGFQISRRHNQYVPIVSGDNRTGHKGATTDDTTTRRTMGESVRRLLWPNAIWRVLARHHRRILGFPEVEIVHSTSTKAVIPKHDAAFSRYQIPIEINTDNGPSFNGKEIAKFSPVKVWNTGK